MPLPGTVWPATADDYQPALPQEPLRPLHQGFAGEGEGCVSDHRIHQPVRIQVAFALSVVVTK